MPGLTPIQSDIQAICRAVTGNAGTYNEDLYAFLTSVGATGTTLDEKITGYATLYGSTNPTNSEGWQRLLDLAPARSMDLRATAQNGGLTNTIGDPPLTFARTSNATMFDSTGKLVYAPANMQPNSADSRQWSAPVGVDVARNQPDPFGTLTAIAVYENTSNTNHYTRANDISSLAPSQVYTTSAYVKAGARRYIRFRMNDQTSGIEMTLDTQTGQLYSSGVLYGATMFFVRASITAVSGGWFRCALTGYSTNASPVLTQGTFGMDATPSDSYTGVPGTICFYMAAPQHEPTSYNSPQTYVPTLGGAFYGPRFDYDPLSLAPYGLLMEEARTNSLLWSDNLTNWSTKTDSTPAQNAVGITGQANSAWTVTEGVAGTAIMTGQCASSGVFPTTGSIFLKRGNTDWVRVCISDSTVTNGYFVWVNLNTGTLGSTAALGLGTLPITTIRSVGNGWHRVSIKCVPDGVSTTMALSVNTASADASAVRVANGTYLACGAQVEGFSSLYTGATSLIPTTGQAVTRTVESCVGSWGGSVSNLTIFVSMRQTKAIYGGSVNLRGANSNESVMLYSQDNYFMITGGAAQFDRTIVAAGDGVLRKDIGMHTPAQQKIATNGGAVTTFATASTAPTVTALRLGDDRFLANQLNGWIQRFAIWTTGSFPDAVLSKLSGMT